MNRQITNPPTPTDPYTRRHVLAQAAGDAAHEAAADADKSLAYMHAYQRVLGGRVTIEQWPFALADAVDAGVEVEL